MSQVAQHVGTTRSGKAIQVPIFSDEQLLELPEACALYTPADHLDAYAVCEYLLSRELRRRPQVTLAMNMYQNMSSAHDSKLDGIWRETECLALGLATIFDVLEHGESLTDRVFKD